MFFKKKEEFIRNDPDESGKVRWFTILNWIVPILCVVLGIFLSTQKFAELMNYDYRIVGEPLFILNKSYRVYNPIIFLLGMFKYAFNETYSYYFFEAIPSLVICLVVAVLFFIIISIFTQNHQKNKDIYGTAAWSNVKKLEQYGMLLSRGVVCGQLHNADVGFYINKEKASLVLTLPKRFGKIHIAPLICHSGQTNTLLLAPTRSGKGVNSIIPTLLSYGVPYWEYDKSLNKKVLKGRKSIVCFDPKGENWDATAGFRSTFSVCIPFRPLDAEGNTGHYNPIHEIPDSVSEAYSWADIIGEIFFGAEKAKSEGATEYFNNTARDIFTGVVLHVRFSDSIPWEEKNLGKVLDIFSQANDEGQKSQQQGEDGDPSCGAKMISELRNTHHIHDNHKDFPEIHDLVSKAANRSEIQNPKERASTYSTIFSKISLFQDPLIRKATAYSDFSIDDFINGKNGISLYLIVPYNHIKRISPVFRMLITFMIKKFSSGTTNANAVKLKNPCMFLLDEFPVLGYFPDIALNAGILAGYGVTFFIVCQSLSQLIDIYGENHPFLDHCKTIILFAPGNIKDARQFSDTIGNRSVLLDNISSSGTKLQVGSRNISRSSQETSVSLISPDELMKLEFNSLIVLNQGQPPYRGKKVVYYEDPRFKNKSFRKTPEMKDIYSLMKTLPSRRKKHILIKNAVSIKEKIQEVEGFEVKKVIKADIF